MREDVFNPHWGGAVSRSSNATNISASSRERQKFEEKWGNLELTDRSLQGFSALGSVPWVGDNISTWRVPATDHS